MIKINLLEVERERRPKAAPTGGVPTGAMFLGILGLSIAAFVLYYIVIDKRLTELQQDVAEKEAKKRELEPYIKRADELEQRKKEMEKKNHAIEELRSQRTIPVHILDEVSRALPEYLWLSSLTVKGEVLQIEGETIQEQAIPTFMKSLDASEFIGTCSLIETVQKAPGTQGNSTTFKISAPITNPFKPKAPEETTSTTRRAR